MNSLSHSTKDIAADSMLSYIPAPTPAQMAAPPVLFVFFDLWNFYFTFNTSAIIWHHKSLFDAPPIGQKLPTSGNLPVISLISSKCPFVTKAAFSKSDL